jgi:peptide/nickel transport system substrate-binding protein
VPESLEEDMNHSKLACSLVLLLAVTACSSGGRSEDRAGRKAQTGGTYTTAMATDPGNLHPLKATQQTTNTVIAFAYDSLIHVNGEGKVVPELASAWTASAQEVTFTLREGVTCTDGTELTPSIVAKTFEWVKDPAHSSSLIGTNLPSADFTVSADDTAHTVTIRVSEPDGFLLDGAGLVPIVCPKGLADPKSLARTTDGTGPFALTEYTADQQLVMEARKDYTWGPDGARTDEPGFPAKVVFRIVQNNTTAVNLFLSGQLTDVTPTGAEQARVKARGGFTMESQAGPSDLFFNERPGYPGSDPDVRRALTMALDLDQLAKVVSEGDGTRATGLAVLKPQPCPADTVTGHVPEHDKAAAEALLDGAGWTMGSDGVRVKDGKPLSVTLGYLSGEDPIAAGMELVSEWWKDIGVQVKTKGQGANAYLGTLFGGSGWDAGYLSVQLVYPSEFVPFGSGPQPPKGQNFAAIDNAGYTDLSGRAESTPAAEGGCELWGRAEQALFDAADVVPVANTVGVTYADRAVFTEGLTSLVEPTSIRLYER